MRRSRETELLLAQETDAENNARQDIEWLEVKSLGVHSPAEFSDSMRVHVEKKCL